MAHAEIDVGDGQYVMEVGFRDEPTYLGLPNALALSVQRYATGGTEPVNDLAATLSAEVSRDGQTMPLPLVPVGEGEYEAAFVPTATGDYTFRISGTIGEATVDESVTSGPTTFNSVEPLSAIEFPAAPPDPVQLQTAVADANAAAATARTLGHRWDRRRRPRADPGRAGPGTVEAAEGRGSATRERTVRQADSMTTSPSNL